MIARFLRITTWLTVRHPALVTAVMALITVALYANIRNLKLGTNLTDLFGSDTPQWRAVNEFTEKLGYGNRFLVVVESANKEEEGAQIMEAAADRLIAEMNSSGYFKSVKSGVTEDELLGIVRLFTWNFPFFVKPEQADALRRRLSAGEIEATIRKAGAGLVTPFSSLGTRYFVNDPLNLMEFVSDGGRAFADQVSFDLNWGSGNRFFNKDHSALLITTEPRLPATNYEFAGAMVGWTRQHIESLLKEKEFQQPSLSLTPSGAYLYAEQDHRFIQENIRLVSLVSIIGNIALCLLVYPRIPILLMAMLPTGLGILWTTGIIAWYPGQINLISLSFIAILAGLGDDQVIHFFNRVPQEWRGGRTLEQAVAATYDTTGRSILFCIMTVATATASLWHAQLKGLAEFGLVLTIGLLMLLVHTLFTVPALMRLWWKASPPSAPEDVTFRFLPRLARGVAGILERRAKPTLALSLAIFALSLAALPFLRMDRKIEITRGQDDPAWIGQRRLGEKFGIVGNPEVMLFQGAQDRVLEKAYGLSAALDPLKPQGIVKSVYTPTEMVPPGDVQRQRARALDGIDFIGAAAALERSLRNNGFNVEPFRATLDRLRQLGSAKPIGVEEAAAYLPQGLLDSSIRAIGANAYLAAVAVYPADPNATQIVPDAAMSDLQRRFGPFTEFSFDRINRDLQQQILHDSTTALALTFGGIFLIVYLCFRTLSLTMLVLAPIVFSMVATIAILITARYPMSYMALTAFPLIVGIGIDNGIHLMRRFQEESDRSVPDVVMSSGAALIQSNLTTIVGFGALMVARFKPLEEMGLVTAIGVAMALLAALFLLPAAVIVFPGLRRRVRPMAVNE